MISVFLHLIHVYRHVYVFQGLGFRVIMLTVLYHSVKVSALSHWLQGFSILAVMGGGVVSSVHRSLHQHPMPQSKVLYRWKVSEMQHRVSEERGMTCCRVFCGLQGRKELVSKP